MLLIVFAMLRAGDLPGIWGCPTGRWGSGISLRWGWCWDQCRWCGWAPGSRSGCCRGRRWRGRGSSLLIPWQQTNALEPGNLVPPDCLPVIFHYAMSVTCSQGMVSGREALYLQHQTTCFQGFKPFMLLCQSGMVCETVYEYWQRSWIFRPIEKIYQARGMPDVDNNSPWSQDDKATKFQLKAKANQSLHSKPRTRHHWLYYASHQQQLQCSASTVQSPPLAVCLWIPTTGTKRCWHLY